MRLPDVDRRLAQLSAAQYGMFTIPQANRSGISLKSLQARFRLGLLEWFDDVIIRHPATPMDAHARARAAWIGAGDERLSLERTQPVDAVVTSFAAARVLGLGRPDGPLELLIDAPSHALPASISTRVDAIGDSDWTEGPGFLVARPARAVADMLAHLDAMPAAAAALTASKYRRDYDEDRLIELLKPMASRHGFAHATDLHDALQAPPAAERTAP